MAHWPIDRSFRIVGNSLPGAPDMVDTPPAVRLEDLTPLPYQQALAAHLQANEPEVWRWAASAEAREEHAAAVRADLLRNSYRLDADAHPELHAHCNAAVQRLGITARVALYQAATAR
jgi:hypothetical protein